jgi:ubiquinone/menaquinone biosynthesis C-methylase UbiE
MTAGTAGPRVNWDYTEHAAYYDKRADYSADAIDEALEAIACARPEVVADIGAGTGKLTKELLERGLVVSAVEPNDAMRAIGIENTRGRPATWSVGTGEATGLRARSVYAAFFGSSFNVVDQRMTLQEMTRILVPSGWFVCMWNHRDLGDPVQQRIESIITAAIPAYSYGSRREDPTPIIETSGRFRVVQSIVGTQVWGMSKDDVRAAWKSHATLRRQAASDAIFDRIIENISSYLEPMPDVIAVPYTTRIYFAQALP